MLTVLFQIFLETFRIIASTVKFRYVYISSYVADFFLFQVVIQRLAVQKETSSILGIKCKTVEKHNVRKTDLSYVLGVRQMG